MRRRVHLFDRSALDRLAPVQLLYFGWVHSPKSAQELVAKLCNREKGVTVRLSVFVADGLLKLEDRVFAAYQLQGLVKRFAF